MDKSPIEKALETINQTYRPGLLLLIKQFPDDWNEMKSIESRINDAVRCKDDTALISALDDYEDFFQRFIESKKSKGF